MASPAATRRRVVVVGAGPAGLEAARVCAERGHSVELIEAMPAAGGQLLVAARNKRRRDLLGIVDWRVAECRRLGVRIRLDTLADADMVLGLEPDVVLIATGGLPRSPELDSGADLVSSAWDVLGGHVRATGSVLFWDDAGTHAAMSAAEHLAISIEQLEIVTPERSLGVDVGGLTFTGYTAALVNHDVRVTLNHRLLALRREDRAHGGRLVVTLGSEYSPRQVERVVDLVVAELGTDANDELYLELRDRSGNGGAVDYPALVAVRPQPVPDSFSLFRIGDAVASRNVHAAIYDAQRLCSALQDACPSSSG